MAPAPLATPAADLAPLADLAKALAHPARLRILQLLAETRGCLCGSLVDRLPLAQATVSQHLKVLKDAGLIRGEISGPRTCYCLDPRALAAAQAACAAFWTALDAGTNGGDDDER